MSGKPQKTVKVAELKAQLSVYLRAARHGQVITVYDRDTPVARLVPYAATEDPLPSRPPTRPWGEIRLPAPIGRRVDSLAALLQDRQSSR